MNRPERRRFAPVGTSGTRIRRVGAALAVALALGAGSAAFADEDWSAFLDALKTRGYDDVALVYLKQLQSTGQAPPELDAELDYHIGAAAFEEGISATGARRDQLFGEAVDAFGKYLAASPDGASALEARAGLARVQADRGGRLLADASRKGTSESARTEKLELARTTLSDAKKSFAAAIKLSQERVKALKGDSSARTDDLRNAQANFLDLNIRYAGVQAQIARTYPVGSDNYKSGLTDAAARFNKIFTTYQQYAGAFKARLSEAQIQHELGDDDAALATLSELAVLPFEEEFYSLKTRALLLFAEIVDGREEYDKLIDLVVKYNDWSEGQKLPDAYYQSAEGKKIALYAAKAVMRLEKLRRGQYDAYAAAGKKAFVDSDDPGYKLFNIGSKKNTTKLVVLAVKILSSVGSGRTEEAMEAQELLKDDLFKDVDLAKYSFTQKGDDFDSAADIATRAAAAFSEKRMNFLAADPDLQADAYREMETTARIALDAFHDAVDLSAKASRPDKRAKLPEETVENVRLELNKLALKDAVVAFAVERYEEAFIMADAAAHDEDFEDAAQGAVIALRALQAMAANAKAAGSIEAEAFDARVKEYVAFSSERWGDDDNSPIAQEAIVARLEAAASEGNVADALDALAKIPEESPRRASSELMLGRALWAEWARRSAKAAENPDVEAEPENDADDFDLDSLLEYARKALNDGLERKILSDAGVQEDDASAIYADYLLAQAYAQQGDFTNAEKWLTHPKIGALTVVNRADDDAADAEVPAFVDDSFRIAVLALELRVAASDPNRLDDAKKTMGRLDALVAESPDAASKLTRVYLSLGKRFEERLANLRKQADAGDESKLAELKAATAGFETFLNSVADRDDGNSYASLRWIAESYLAIGKELLGKDGAMTPEAAPYFAKARDACKKIVANIDADTEYAPAKDSRVAVLLKVCEILRYEGKFSVAYKNLCSLITTAKDNVDAQWEAASLLEAWGDADPAYYAKAIAGDAPNGERIVWGWNGIIKRLAPAVSKDQRYKTMYFDACKAKVRTRFKYVRSIKDAEEKKRQAQAAEDDVRRLAQTHPGFNGPETVKYFDDAYRGFQKLRGAQTIESLKEAGKK